MGLLTILLLTSACNAGDKDEPTLAVTNADTEIKPTEPPASTEPTLQAEAEPEYTFHHVKDCLVCHGFTGSSSNIRFIRDTINTPNSGPKRVIFTTTTGPNSFADGDETYDGPCEVCHTKNAHHLNDGADNTAHFDGTRCTQCHLHGKQFAPPHKQSHQTHVLASQAKGPRIECTTCHNDPLVDPLIFADMKPLATTTVCDACHSPSGSYPGADGLFNADIGAKANFKTGGIYNADRLTLKPGKEKWCSTCHDEQQSISKPSGAPVAYAPNVIGDNTSYGYFATGHGKTITNCLECHDARKKHIDHEHRTYEIDETNDSVVTNSWGDSYRLRTSNSKANELFCVKCHDRKALTDVGGQSNFKNERSGHEYHIWGSPFKAKRWADTDYDGVIDGKTACVTCHNVHGSKSSRMVKTGELASTLGTNDRTPGLNHTYVKPATGPFSTATWTPNFPTAGNFGVYVWWQFGRFLEPKAKYTINHSSGSNSIIINQNDNSDSWVSLGSYNFQAGTGSSVILSADHTQHRASLLADKIGFDTNGDAIPDIIIDDADPEFSSIDLMNNGAAWPWRFRSEARALYNEERFKLDVTLAESTAGYVRFNPDGGNNIQVHQNKACNNCHGRYAYPRTPFMGPKVINRFEEKRWVLNNGTVIADIVVSVTDPDGDMTGGSVNIDTSSLGGGSSIAMTNNGDGTFSYQLTIVPGTLDKAYNLPITATDNAGNVGTGTSSVFVKSSVDSIYLDNIDAVHTSADNWERPPANVNAYNGSYTSTRNFIQFPDADSGLTATWTTPIKKTGRYKIYAWLFNHYLFHKNATYTIHHRDGTTTVPMNQEGVSATGSWELLGTFNYEAGAEASITVGATELAVREQIFVDAIKLELIP